MMSQGKLIIILLFALTFILTGCFEDDEKVPPHVPGDELTYEFTKSMYTDQAFLDLGTNEVNATNVNGEWTMKFGALAGDWQIGVNSADYWGVYPSGTTNQDSIPEKPPVEDWIFDASSGDPDSSAFAGYVTFPGEDTLYTEYIYLLGKYDGFTYKATYAVQFHAVDHMGYMFRIKTWPSGEWGDYEILKDDMYNYIYFSASQREIKHEIEPVKNNWDLLFTQYGSIIYTDEGEPTPYYVRGVLLNRNLVTVAIDSVKAFQDISSEDLTSYSYSRRQDIIGYVWKDVEVDVNSNTAIYTVRPGITYVIMDSEGVFFKMRFISYYNDSGEKGFPVIEHARL